MWISSHSTTATCGCIKSNGVDLEELNVPLQMIPTRSISGASMTRHNDDEAGDVIGRSVGESLFIISSLIEWTPALVPSYGSNFLRGRKIALFSIYHSQGSFPPLFPFPALNDQSKNAATNLKPIGFPLTLVTANPAPQDGQPLIKFPPLFFFFAFLSLSFWVYVLFLYRFSSLNHAQEK